MPKFTSEEFYWRKYPDLQYMYTQCCIPRKINIGGHRGMVPNGHCNISGFYLAVLPQREYRRKVDFCLASCWVIVRSIDSLPARSFILSNERVTTKIEIMADVAILTDYLHITIQVKRYCNTLTAYCRRG